MKAKQHRKHYERKQLQKTDPQLVCRVGVKHYPADPINYESTDDWTVVRYFTTCVHCHTRIEISLSSWGESAGSRFLGEAPWRTELYIIQEVPW